MVWHIRYAEEHDVDYKTAAIKVSEELGDSLEG